MTRSAVQELIKGMSRVISHAAINSATLAASLQAFFEPLSANAQAALTAGAADAAIKLERLAFALRYLEFTEVTPAIAQQLRGLWPLLDAVLAQAAVLPGDAVEEAGRGARYLLGTLQAASADLFPTVMERVVTAYESSSRSLLLMTVVTAVTVYDGNPTLRAHLSPSLAGALAATSAKSLTILSASPTALVDNPDVICDYFYLAEFALQRAAELLLAVPTLGAVVQCSAACLGLAHRDSNQSACKFLRRFLELPRKTPEATALVAAQVGPVLVPLLRSLLGNVCGGVSTFLVPDQSTLLWALTTLAPVELLAELNAQIPVLVAHSKTAVPPEKVAKFIALFQTRLV